MRKTFQGKIADGVFEEYAHTANDIHTAQTQLLKREYHLYFIFFTHLII